MRAGFGKGGETTEQIAGAEEGEEGFEADEGIPGVAVYFLLLIKVTILMGIGSLGKHPPPRSGHGRTSL